MELLEKLGINLGLLIAQILNFGIVLALLTYFLYRPFLDLLDRRRGRVAKAMEDAKRIENQMEELRALREETLKKLDHEAGELMEAMRKKADVFRDKLLSDAKAEAENLLKGAEKRIAEDRRKMFEEVMASVRRIIIAMTEKILEREFSPADQKRLIDSLQKDLTSYKP